MMKAKAGSGENAEELKQMRREEFIVITKKRTYFLVAIVIILIIVVGVLAGVLSAKSARDKAMRESAGGSGDTKPTEPASTAAPTPTPTEKTRCLREGPWCNVRLPAFIRPLHYNLFLHPNLTQGDFKGKVDVVIHVNRSTKYVLIHKRSMNITKHKIYKQKEGVTSDSTEVGTEMGLQKPYESKANEFFVLVLEEELKPGKYVVKLEYEAVLSTELNGFYKSSYKDKNGRER